MKNRTVFWLELLGGLLGWVWILLSVATFVSFLLALFSEFSWWYVLFFFIASYFFKRGTIILKNKWEDSLKTIDPPLEEDWVEFSFDVRFTPEQYETLEKGFISSDYTNYMWSLYLKDKEFIIERSSTKTPVYKLFIQKDKSGYYSNKAATKFIVDSEEFKFHEDVIKLLLETLYKDVR